MKKKIVCFVEATLLLKTEIVMILVWNAKHPFVVFVFLLETRNTVTFAMMAILLTFIQMEPLFVLHKMLLPRIVGIYMLMIRIDVPSASITTTTTTDNVPDQQAIL